MRILHFLWGLAQGGAENLAVDLANEQCREHQVTVMVANQAIDSALAGRLSSSIRLVHLNRPEGSRNPLWILRMLAAIRALRPDIVHSHAGNLANLARFISAPLILTVHANNVRLPKQASKFAAICCISRTVEDDVRARYPKLSTHLVVNGVNTSEIAVRTTPFARPLRAVQVSRLAHETKGQDLLVEAIATVNSTCREPQLTVDFIGKGDSLSYLVELATAHGVINCCNFVGAKTREEVFANLHHYDLLVQPSRDEGFGLTVAEGMAAGIPVVVSDLPGPMEVIGHGRHGYHFKNNDSKSLAATLIKAMDDIQAGALGPRLSEARQSVVDQFDLAHTSESYLKIYGAVAHGN